MINVRGTAPHSLRCLAVALAGCVPFNEVPRSQPHATVTLRRIYEKTAGSDLFESCMVNGNDLLGKRGPSERATSLLVGAISIYPLPSRIVIRADFAHDEQQTFPEMGLNGHWHDVTRSVSVGDGGCWTRIWLAAEAGHSYVVDFTYRGNNACSAACVEPVAVDGAVALRPCPQPTAEQEEHLEVQKGINQAGR